jgi:hypothetical protein
MSLGRRWGWCLVRKFSVVKRRHAISSMDIQFARMKSFIGYMCKRSVSDDCPQCHSYSLVKFHSQTHYTFPTNEGR